MRGNVGGGGGLRAQRAARVCRPPAGVPDPHRRIRSRASHAQNREGEEKEVDIDRHEQREQQQRRRPHELIEHVVRDDGPRRWVVKHVVWAVLRPQRGHRVSEVVVAPLRRVTPGRGARVVSSDEAASAVTDARIALDDGHPPARPPRHGRRGARAHDDSVARCRQRMGCDPLALYPQLYTVGPLTIAVLREHTPLAAPHLVQVRQHPHREECEHVFADAVLRGHAAVRL